MVRDHRCRATSRFVLGVHPLFENLSSRSFPIMAPRRRAPAGLYPMRLNIRRLQRVTVDGRKSECAMVTYFDSAHVM